MQYSIFFLRKGTFLLPPSWAGLCVWKTQSFAPGMHWQYHHRL